MAGFATECSGGATERHRPVRSSSRSANTNGSPPESMSTGGENTTGDAALSEGVMIETDVASVGVVVDDGDGGDVVGVRDGEDGNSVSVTVVGVVVVVVVVFLLLYFGCWC